MRWQTRYAIVCYVRGRIEEYISQYSGVEFRFCHSVYEPIGWIAETGSDIRAGWCERAAWSRYLEDSIRGGTTLLGYVCDRLIDLASKRQPTANVNYHALFLFINAREPHSHRVSVIKNVFLALCLALLKEKYLRGLKSEEEKKTRQECGEEWKKDEGREHKRHKKRKYPPKLIILGGRTAAVNRLLITS